jgi:site-specific recombinase XerD
MKGNKRELSPRHYLDLKDYLAGSLRPEDICLDVLRSTGMRPAELCGMVAGDMDLAGGRLYIRARKGCHDRWLPIGGGLAARLQVVIERMSGGPAGVLWTKSEKVPQQVQTLRRYFDKLQIALWGEKLYCLYALRHQFAHQCYGRMHDIRKVQRVMGHKYVTSTERYLRQVAIDEMEEEIKDAVR